MIQEKLGRQLTKFLHDAPSDSLCDVFIKKRTRFGYDVRLTLEVPNKRLTSSNTHKHLTSALIGARNDLKRQLRRAKA